MNDEIEPDPWSNEEGNAKPQEPAEQSQETSEPQSTEQSKTSNNLEDIIKNLAGKQSAESIEFLSSLAAANVYINFHNGGVYFEDEVKIRGDFVTGNQTKSTKRTSVKKIAGQVFITNIEKVRSVYIETKNYHDAQSILDDKHILILRGDANFGKQTTAIHLLSLQETEQIFEIDPAIEDLSLFECETKQVYLIDSLAADSAAKLNSYVLNGLRQKFKGQQSYLVITLDSRVPISEETLADYILNWSELPSSDRLLEKHLKWYLQQPELLDSSYAMIQSVSVRELLDNNKLLPAEIDTLASLLVKVINQDLKLEDALASFHVSAYKQIKNWFESEEQDLSQRILMISLAVLSGSSYQVVKNASQRLQLLITDESEPESISAVVFNQTRSQVLKKVFAHLVQGYENVEYRGSPVEIVEFDNPIFQPAVLSYIWHEYDNIREPLLVWLHELGSHRDAEVRTRAAAAIGELSKYAFRDVLNKVLRPWANSSDNSLQKLAALALSVPIFDSNLAPQVLGLLHSWSTLENNFNLRWTATAAYSGYVGLRFPEIALRDLFAIARTIFTPYIQKISSNPEVELDDFFAIASSEELLLFSAVVEGVASLFATGKFVTTQYFTVLNALEEWTSQTKTIISRLLTLLGLLIFWRLMREDKIPVGLNNDRVPTLLWLAKESQVYEDLIICLLRRALNFKQTRIPVLNEIDKWLKIADYDHRMKRVIGRIIYTLVSQGTERERERILYKLNQWALREPDNTASEILSIIKKNLRIY